MDAIRSTVGTRRALSFGTGAACALAAAVWFSAAPGAALPGPDESTFVPIVPCRVMDTRPEPEFNVGARVTPLGPAETHRMPVTGNVGNCAVPADATAVALNVTAVDATAGSYLTLFPFEADRPTSSNLNFTPGSAPTPNKVDVRLSPAGELGVFNAFGQVDVVVDVTGYYTATGLHDLVAALAAKANTSDVYTRTEIDAALAGKANTDDVYTQAEIDTALAGKANTDDVYTQAQIDTALAGKANTDDVYTQAEVEARTQIRTVDVSPQSVRIPEPTPAFDVVAGELWWDYDATASAGLRLARPADWTGDSPVTLRILYTRTPNAGDVRVRAFVRSFETGSSTNALGVTVNFSPQGAAGSNIAREVSGQLSAIDLQDAWWDIEINRPTGGGADYTDPIFVRSIALEYEATT